MCIGFLLNSYIIVIIIAIIQLIFFSGGNNMTARNKGKIIINGETIDLKQTHRLSKLDKSLSFDICENIKKVSINSTIISINVLRTTSNRIYARLYSDGEIIGDANLTIHQHNDELMITAEFSGICYSGTIKLEISIPEKQYLTQISIN